MDPTPEPWWKQYLIPTLLSFAVAFSGWSVTQHFVIRGHDTEQEQRLATMELRLTLLERNNGQLAELVTKMGVIDARQQMVLSELARLRTEVEQSRRNR